MPAVPSRLAAVASRLRCAADNRSRAATCSTVGGLAGSSAARRRSASGAASWRASSATSRASAETPASPASGSTTGSTPRCCIRATVADRIGQAEQREQLARHALAAEALERGRELGAGLLGLGVELAAEARREAVVAQDTQVILADALAGIADEPHAVRLRDRPGRRS